jgi:hypothetical protein
MTRRFLKETNSAGFRSLVVGQHQVHDSWDQIQAFLASAFSPAHAAIFAEPFRGQGNIIWMADTTAEPISFAQLDDDARGQVLATLDGLLVEISDLAAEKSDSNSASDQQWGALLSEIQKFPTGPELEDMLYVADGQPIMTQWGTRDEHCVTLASVLAEKRAAPEPVVRRTNQPEPPVTPTATAFGNGSGRALGVWGWLLWLLFFLLVAAIFWWLLLACRAGVPGAPRLFGNCMAQDNTVVAQERQNDLVAELDRLNRRASQSPQCQVETVQPAPELEIIPITPPAEPIDSAADPNETDIDRAREEAEGQVGGVTVTLIWNGHSDLDLVIHCPEGQLLTKDGAGGGPGCGGEIDVDANFCSSREDGPGSRCLNYHVPPTMNPIENGFFVTENTQSGAYKIVVRHYAAASQGANVAVPFAVQLRKGNVRERFEGTVEPGQSAQVTEFSTRD